MVTAEAEYGEQCTSLRCNLACCRDVLLMFSRAQHRMHDLILSYYYAPRGYPECN